MRTSQDKHKLQQFAVTKAAIQKIFLGDYAQRTKSNLKTTAQERNTFHGCGRQAKESKVEVRLIHHSKKSNL